MAEKSPVPGPTLAEKREKTIQLLIDSFASDRLSVEDFEDRLDQAHRAPDAGSLESLVSDLPVAVGPGAQPGRPAQPSQLPANRPSPPLPSEVREKQILVAIMGGHERKGVWTPARKTMVLAMMGGAELDFREARLSSGVTEIEIFALMGGVEILVPPGVRIDAGGMAIMGSFAHGAGNNESTAPDAPVIRIGGIAIMGGVEVHVRLPGETAREARRRLKEQQKQLKSRPRELP